MVTVLVTGTEYNLTRGNDDDEHIFRYIKTIEIYEYTLI